MMPSGVVFVVLGDAGADFGDALLDFILGEQDAIDVFVHDDYLFDAFALGANPRIYERG